MSLPRRWKSTLADKVITVIGTKDEFGMRTNVPIDMKICAYELDYGPVIDVEIKCNIGYQPGIWIDHPLNLDKNCIDNPGILIDHTNYEVSEIIDDTPVTRAIIAELANPTEKNLYTTTDCTYRAALIASLKNFWS